MTYMNISDFMNKIFKNSPWDNLSGGGSNSEEKSDDNIFTKKRKPNLNLNNIQFNFNKNMSFILIIAFVFFWLSSGIYKVQEGQQGAVLRFGKFDRISTPGLNYHLPYPFENVIVERVNKSRRMEIGYRSSSSSGLSNSISRDISSESVMLTGDENIVELQADVIWSISDISQYVFNIADPSDSVKAAAESAIRDVIGNTPISSVLSSKKQEISSTIEDLLQEILNNYNAGVRIEQVQLLKAEPPKEVIQSYRDVQTSRADKEREINQAQSYSNDIIPQARGQAAEILQRAEGYSAEKIARAKGEASRFNAVYRQYSDNREVMRNRLYIDTVEEILRESDKVIMGGDGMLPHMSVGNK